LTCFDKFAAAPQIPRDRNAREIGLCVLQPFAGVFQQLSGAVHVKASFPAFGDFDVLQDLSLQRCAKTLGGFDPIVARRLLQFSE
jgi:hypothetical protein